MKRNMKKRAMGIGPIIVLLTVIQLASCSSSGVAQSISGTWPGATETVRVSSVIESSLLLDRSEMFTERDLEQTADVNEAAMLELSNGENTLIDEEGIYVLSGDYQNAVIIVDADDEAKIQLVLDELIITNENSPAIYVKSADKIFITTKDSKNSLTVSGTFEKDGDTNLDAVIFSRSDLVINGTGTLEIESAEGNGITSKDDLKITGGNLIVYAHDDGLEANDSIRIYDGNISIEAGADALHSENDEDPLSGYIYIQSGTLDISAADDGIRGNSIIQIDGGIINISTCKEGIEATHIQINGGTLVIYATDDGINATARSTIDIVIEVYGGDISVTMASGDTDAFDSNGDLFIYGGDIDIAAQSSFDANGTAQLVNGNVTINGTAVAELPQGRTGGGPGRRGR
ncbi:MAG: carbohydrate-binding domain-containing protein [Spirochaetales bacterium]|jgi:hypothetical protein|nr:carbohydrate-binding domain-containing protein [Spirochaetales bacterium]